MKTVHEIIDEAYILSRKIHRVIWNPNKSITYSDYFETWKWLLRRNRITAKVVNLLDGVPQGTHFHPEFDALLHTYYVCKAIRAIGRNDLLEAAFLHDVGKGTQTTIGSDKIYHFGHPKASVKFIDEIKIYLKNYELTRRLADDHMKYNLDNKKLNDDPDLRALVTADKKVSKELYDGDSDWSDRVNNRYKETMVHLKQRFSSKKLYVMVGVPGAGKSRYLDNVDSKLIVSSDSIRREIFGNVNTHRTQDVPAMEVWNIAAARLRVNLELYGKAYLDATNVHKFFRVEFMAPYNDCRKIAVVFDVEPKIAKARVRADIINGKDRSNVPEKAIDKMYKYFKQGERSLKSEFNKVIYIKD